MPRSCDSTSRQCSPKQGEWLGVGIAVPARRQGVGLLQQRQDAILREDPRVELLRRRHGLRRRDVRVLHRRFPVEVARHPHPAEVAPGDDLALRPPAGRDRLGQALTSDEEVEADRRGAGKVTPAAALGCDLHEVRRPPLDDADQPAPHDARP